MVKRITGRASMHQGPVAVRALEVQKEDQCSWNVKSGMR